MIKYNNMISSEITLDRILRILKRLEVTMKDHEIMCVMCAYWVKQDSDNRCDEYQNMREIYWKWGKRHDDSH